MTANTEIIPNNTFTENIVVKRSDPKLRKTLTSDKISY